MNIKTLAQKTGISTTTISGFVNDRHSINLKAFRKLLSRRDKFVLDEMIERTKSSIKRNSGKHTKTESGNDQV